MCCGQKRSQMQIGQAPRPAQYIGKSQRQAVGSPSPAQSPIVSQPARLNSLSYGVKPEPPLHASTPGESIAVRYLEAAPVRVQGLATGRSYEFVDSRPVQIVDARDAASLLSTRFFRRA
jgi:hypothetical protein